MAKQAIFRPVQTTFWSDIRVQEEMTPEDKLFYLYLLTNPHTRQIGIYTITKKTMAFELGYSIETINSLMERFEHYHKIINYNNETREIAILNWGKYNFNKGGKPVEDCVKSELEEVKDVSLVYFIAQRTKNERIRSIFDEFLGLNIDDESDNHEEYGTSNDTSTTRGEKQQEEEKEEEKKEKQQQQENRLRAIPNQNEKVVVGKQAIRFYAENFGMITPFIADDIHAWVEDLNEEIVIKAMQISLEQNIRNMKYVKSILHDWHSKGFVSIRDVELAQEQFRSQRQKTKNSSFPRKKELVPDWLHEEKTSEGSSESPSEHDQDELKRKIEERRKRMQLKQSKSQEVQV